MLKTMLSTPAGTVRLIAIVTAIAMLLAVAPWPYGYYQLLRVIGFFAGIYCAVALLKSGDDNYYLAGALFTAAFIFNPFLPVHLPRGIWAPINIVASGLFAVAAYKHRE